MLTAIRQGQKSEAPEAARVTRNQHQSLWPGILLLDNNPRKANIETHLANMSNRAEVPHH